MLAACSPGPRHRARSWGAAAALGLAPTEELLVRLVWDRSRSFLLLRGPEGTDPTLSGAPVGEPEGVRRACGKASERICVTDLGSP